MSVLFAIAICSRIFYADTSNFIKPENSFSHGPLSYRKMLIDQKTASIYVGTNDNLFKLWAYNINDTTTEGLYEHAKVPISMTAKEECRQMGYRDCLNGIRLMVLSEDHQRLIVCSSNAMKPQLREFDAKTLRTIVEPQNVIGICSTDPSMNTTAVYVEWGNPDDIPAFYTGIRTGLSLENHLIYRPPLIFNDKEIYSSMRSVYTDSKWLNDPQFVASFSVGNYVYFFFREIAAERSNCDHVVYSRVARLCKSDVGGKNVLRQVWTSFVKARLNCSIPSAQYPFHFDQIQSVQKVEYSSDVLIYATFIASEIHFGGSAICLFSLNAINQVFDQGLFIEQSGSGRDWTITPNEDVPSHRPGTCCSKSFDIADGDLHFAKTHLLMAESVRGVLLFAQPTQIFTHIAVDTVGSTDIVFVYSHNTLVIHKLAHWDGFVDAKSKWLSTYAVTNLANVFSMVLLPSEFLYLSDENTVLQYSVAQCHLYSTCVTCAVDPYCSWNSARMYCYQRKSDHSSAVGWVSIAPDEEKKCVGIGKRVQIQSYIGDALHLTCDASQAIWRFNSELLQSSSSKLFTVSGGVVLLNISSGDSGIYECVSNGNVVMIYDVDVDQADCTQPTNLAQFQSVYREWCKKLSDYKLSVNRWQLWYNRNAFCSSEDRADAITTGGGNRM